MENDQVKVILEDLRSQFEAFGESLEYTQEKVVNIEKDVTTIKEDVDILKVEMAGVKTEIVGLKMEMAGVREISEATFNAVGEIKEELTEIHHELANKADRSELRNLELKLKAA